MSLATYEADARNAVENAMDWLKQAVETHLPKIAAVAQEAESDPLIAAIEAVFLPDDVKVMLATLVGKLGTARGAESDASAPAGAEGAPVPAEAPAGAQDAPEPVAAAS